MADKSRLAWERFCANLTEAGRDLQTGGYAAKPDDCAEGYNHLGAQSVVPAMVIVGPQRSGTSKLFRVIAADPQWSKLYTWQAMNPIPLDRLTRDGPDPRIAVAESLVQRMRWLQPAHEMDAHAPEMEAMLLSMAFMTNGPTRLMPTHQRYCETADHRLAYRFLHQMLQFIQWQNGGPRRPWVLKSPSHLQSLGALTEQSPSAKLIMTHRHPAKNVGSMLKLAELGTRSNARSVDPAKIREVWYRILVGNMWKFLAFRDADGDDRWVDIAYQSVHDRHGRRRAADLRGGRRAVHGRERPDHRGVGAREPATQAGRVLLRSRRLRPGRGGYRAGFRGLYPALWPSVLKPAEGEVGVEDDHKGSVAIVTGGARGFGKAFGTALAARGATVALVDRDGPEVAKAAAEIGELARPYEGDVTDEARMSAIMAEAAKTGGGIDILINNAGLHSQEYSRPVEELGLAKVRRLFEVNMIGTVIGTLAARPYMSGRAGANIVNIASSSAYLPGAYGVSKMGVIGLTMTFARELAADQIRVNAIAPGVILTETIRKELAPETIARIKDMQFLAQDGEEEDIVNAMLYLTSSKARFITGETLRVTGGFTPGP